MTKQQKSDFEYQEHQHQCTDSSLCAYCKRKNVTTQRYVPSCISHQPYQEFLQDNHATFQYE